MADVKSGKGDISLQNVTFAFTAVGAPIVEDVGLQIRAGEFFVLLGPSGCGKSTILNLIAGFELPTSGSIACGGSIVRGPHRDRVVIFQDSDSLYGWLTVVENVAFPLRIHGIAPKERREQAMAALKLVGLQEHATKYPSQLSGGMKQRTQIARALVLDSPILLMDEPFAALDAQTRTIQQDELVQLSMRMKRTILFITHDIAEAILLGDKIGVMRAGPRSSIKETISVDLPRPRRRASVAFGELYERINASISTEVLSALRREDSLL
jgi:NitT/TauT family transport system ATP-binding protein